MRPVGFVQGLAIYVMNTNIVTHAEGPRMLASGCDAHLSAFGGSHSARRIQLNKDQSSWWRPGKLECRPDSGGESLNLINICWWKSMFITSMQVSKQLLCTHRPCKINKFQRFIVNFQWSKRMMIVLNNGMRINKTRDNRINGMDT